MKRRQWSLARVTKACRSAPAVWLALEQLAADKGARIVTPTRDLLCKLGGLRNVKTVTLALNTLEAAGWVDRAHFPAYRASGQRVTLLKIILRYTTQKTTRIGTPPIRPVKRSQGKTQKTGRNSPTERGGLNGSALSLSVGSEPSRPPGYREPQPITAKPSVEKITHSAEGDL